MRRLLLTLVFAALAAGTARANPFDDFQGAVQGDIQSFARDFGGMIGASDAHNAKMPSLGGFDVGVGATVVKPSTDYSAPLQSALPAIWRCLSRASRPGSRSDLACSLAAWAFRARP